MKRNGDPDTARTSNLAGVDGLNITNTEYEDPLWWRTPGTWSDKDGDGQPDLWDFDAVWAWDSAAKRPVLRK